MKTGFMLNKFVQSYISKSELIELKIQYYSMLKKLPFPAVQSDSRSHIIVLKNLKRNSFNIGPYENISIFEAANRIATDLTMIDGVLGIIDKDKNLKNGKVMLRFGSKHEQERGDFSFLLKDGYEYEGECFDVAASFFRNKLYKTLKKWGGDDRLRYLVFNSDVLEDKKCAKYFDTRMKALNNKVTVETVSIWDGVKR